MALFSKRIHIVPSGGGEQTCAIYSTTGETGGTYQTMIVDGQTGYVTLVAVDSPRATAGRVRLSNGQTWALGSFGPAAYGFQAFASSGSFTVPANVTRLRIQCVGGGSGGVLGTTNVGQQGDGGTTTVGSISAQGAGQVTLVNGNLTPGGGTYMGTSFGGNDPRSGPPPVYLYTIHGGQQIGGGAGGHSDPDGDPACTGSSGYMAEGYMNVTPGQVISVTIGYGGRYNRFGAIDWGYNVGSGGAHCSQGDPGCALIEWGLGIE